MSFGAAPACGVDVDIGRAELDFYAENGYLVVDGVATPAEIAWLGDVYDALLARPRSGFLDEVFDPTRPYGSLAPPALGQLLAPERFVPEIRLTSVWKNAQRVAARLLEAPIADVHHWGHLVFKSARVGAETPWHQDEAYWDPKLDYQAVAAWLPLQDVDVHNGCLWFLPGSHRRGVLDHRHCGGDPAVHLLETSVDVDRRGAVAVPMSSGAMSFHHPRILHFAGGNRSDVVRRAWANEFQTKPRRRERPAERPWVVEGEAALAERLARARAATAEAR